MCKTGHGIRLLPDFIRNNEGRMKKGLKINLYPCRTACPVALSYCQNQLQKETWEQQTVLGKFPSVAVFWFPGSYRNKG